MIEIKSSSNKIMIEFPKNLISPGDLERFIEKLKTEEIAQKNAMSENEAWNLSEDIKETWWNENKDDILKRIKDHEKNRG